MNLEKKYVFMLKNILILSNKVLLTFLITSIQVLALVDKRIQYFNQVIKGFNQFDIILVRIFILMNFFLNYHYLTNQKKKNRKLNLLVIGDQSNNIFIT